jgi:transcriptional regulator with XRE-family HTH domain
VEQQNEKNKPQNRLREIRNRINMSLEDFAKSNNIGLGSISNYENGKVNPPDELWERWAKAYRVSVAYLKGETDVPDETASNVQSVPKKSKSPCVSTKPLSACKFTDDYFSFNKKITELEETFKDLGYVAFVKCRVEDTFTLAQRLQFAEDNGVVEMSKELEQANSSSMELINQNGSLSKELEETKLLLEQAQEDISDYERKYHNSKRKLNQNMSSFEKQKEEISRLNKIIMERDETIKNQRKEIHDWAFGE